MITRTFSLSPFQLSSPHAHPPPFRSYLSILKLLAGPNLPRLIFWTLVLSLIYFQDLVPAFLVGKTVDFLTGYHTGDSKQPPYILCSALTTIWLLASVIRIHAKALLSNLCVQVAYQAKVIGFERLMDHTVEWHDDENTGNKVQRVTAGSFSLHELLRIAHNDLLNIFVSFIGVMGSFFLFGVIFGVFGIIYFTLFMAIQALFFRLARKTLDDSKRAVENASGTYVEGASNILTIKTLNIEQNITTNVIEREGIARDLKIRLNKINFWKWRIFQFINGLTLGGFLLVISESVLDGEISTGSVLVLFTYLRTLLESAGDSTGMFDAVFDHWATIGRMIPLFESGQGTTHGSSPFPASWREIRLENISAPYQTGSGGLKNFTFTIQKGERIGVVGGSGSGKSTLAKLLIGVHKPTSGTYVIGNTPFSEISPSEVSQHISMVLQESELFNLPLVDNITVMRDIPTDRLLRTVHISHLNQVIEKMPQGLETLIGEKGTRLSGGERQRVSIARAICRTPEILVLDEATSALDVHSESFIHKALATDLKEQTLIIIAHRLSTLHDVDRIIVLENGSIVEEGKFDELVAQEGSRFGMMWKEQKKQREIETVEKE